MSFFESLRQTDYRYILIDGPPLLGIADAQVLAQKVDDTILVTRLDRATLDNVIEVRDLFDRLEVSPLGHVVVGVRRMRSYYYATTASPSAERV
jgi:non-specific protein-tyrosine kinase